MDSTNSIPNQRLPSASAASSSAQPAHRLHPEPRKRRLTDDDDDHGETSSSPDRDAPRPLKRIARNKQRLPSDHATDEPIHVVGNLPPGENIDHSCAFITLSDSTSDEICRTETHLPGGVPDLVNRLEVAAKATESLVNRGWQTRQDIYTRTTVLLLSWADDDLQVQPEIRQLRSLFLHGFRYKVCEWELPSGPGVYLKTVNRIGDFAAKYGGEGTLLIIYYGGHGYQDLARPSSGPIWVSRRRRDGDKEKPAELESGGLSPILAEQDGDVLLIFDCCQAVPSIIRPKGKGVVSALSATGFESGPLGIAPEPGVHSFTHSLVDELAATANTFRLFPNPPPISDIELHVKLVTRLRQSAPSVRREVDGTLKRDQHDLVCFEQQNRRTPHYQFLSEGREPRPIYFKPNIRQKPRSSKSDAHDSAVETGSGEDAASTTSRASPIRTTPGPMVLVRVMLSSDEFDVESWAAWVLKCPKAALDVKIEGQWGSFSTLQIIRVPLELWDLLPRHPAISFIGFVTTENQASRTNEAIAARVKDSQSQSEPSLRRNTDGRLTVRPAAVTLGSCPPYNDYEMRFVVGEMIKFSNVRTSVLADFIHRHGIWNDWLMHSVATGLGEPNEETRKRLVRMNQVTRVMLSHHQVQRTADAPSDSEDSSSSSSSGDSEESASEAETQARASQKPARPGKSKAAAAAGEDPLSPRADFSE